MSDKCRWCGAYFLQTYGIHPQYQCGTLAFMENTPDVETRSPKCYEIQIAQLQARIAELEKLSIRADSMLSLLRHRAEQSIKWGTVGLPTKQEVDEIIGALRSTNRKAALES